MKKTKTFVRRWLPLGLLLCAALCSTPLMTWAQGWVPFIGTQQQTVYRLSAAGRQMVIQSEGVFMRDSNGSVYSRNMPVFGLPPSGGLEARLMDARTGTLYSINYATGTSAAVRQGSGPKRPPAPSQAAPPGATPLGRKMIAGVQCVGYQLTESPTRTVEIWRAPSLNRLAVMFRITDTARHQEVDVMMVSIEPGAQPDPRYFQLPSDPKGRGASR